MPILNCPCCGSGIVRYMGIGTEKLYDHVTKEFNVKGLRLDADSTRKKGGFKGILESFGKGEVSFMVGTQMAAKGHDFRNLTVVGVVDADVGLNLPDFRAAERSYQLLSQVSGRAGRAEKKGKVIIQTLNPIHYALEAAKNHDFLTFYEKEAVLREELCLPPFGRLALLRFQGPEEEETEKQAIRAANIISPILKEYEVGEVELLGPAPSPISRLKERYRFQIMLKTKSVHSRYKILTHFISSFRKDLPKDYIFTVDVDPYHLL
jgi:primosomal protein N' (replication factor Y)